MTVTTTINRKDYVATLGQTVFPYTFKIFATTDLEVYVNDVLQVLTSAYTVSGVGVDAGGNVTFIVGLAAADAVAIVRNVPATQETDYTEYTAFPAESHEAALDKNTILAQQTAELGERAIRYAASYGGTVGREILAPVANEILGYDASKNLTTYTFSGDSGSLDLATNLASTDAGKGSDLVGWTANPGKTLTTALLELADFLNIGLDTDVALAADSDTEVATQKAVKAYADALVAALTIATAASAAEQVTGTETGKYVAPATQQAHPSAAKGWVSFVGTEAAGAATINSAYNVTGVVTAGGDNGIYDITFDVDFANTNYIIVGWARDSDDANGNHFVSARLSDDKSIGSCRVRVFDASDTTRDASEVCLVFFGLQ